jgi:hypothetical protein
MLFVVTVAVLLLRVAFGLRRRVGLGLRDAKDALSASPHVGGLLAQREQQRGIVA